MITRSMAKSKSLINSPVESEPKSENTSISDDESVAEQDNQVHAPTATHKPVAPQWLTAVAPAPNAIPTPTPTPPPTFAEAPVQINSRALAPQKTLLLIEPSATGEGHHTRWIRGAQAAAVSQAVRGAVRHGGLGGYADAVAPVNPYSVPSDEMAGERTIPSMSAQQILHERFITPLGTRPPTQSPLNRQRGRAAARHPHTPCPYEANVNDEFPAMTLASTLLAQGQYGWDSSVTSTPTGAGPSVPLGTPFAGWRLNE